MGKLLSFRKGVASMDHDKALRDHLVSLLTGGNAHMEFDEAIGAFPVDLRGKRPPGGDARSPWEVLEHLRIALWDILEFTRNPEHVSPKWPDEYWPATQSPENEEAWDASAAAYRRHLHELVNIVNDASTDLYSKIPHGDGQTILREALLAADHNSYHIGQLSMLYDLLR